MLKSWLVVLSLLSLGFAAEARYEFVKPEVREATIQEINEALFVHYDSLGANEQWGVGMSCALGRLQNLVREAKALAIDSEAGVIVADSGYRYHLIRGEVRSVLKVSFTPNTEKILIAQVTEQDKRGKVTTCSTRDKLFDF